MSAHTIALEIQRELVRDAINNPAITSGPLATAHGISDDTVLRLLQRQQPVVTQLRSFKRDEFVAGWQWMYLDTLARVQDGECKTMRDRQAAAIVLGIATEKCLLISGQPTAIVANLHEVRVSLPQLVERFSRALGTKAQRVVDVEPGTTVEPGA